MSLFAGKPRFGAVALSEGLRYPNPRIRLSTGDIIMADHSEVAYTTADGNDYVAHEQTYEGFIKLVKYGTASVALIVILMAIFLT
jgi:Bacterial aa3 type cytochrome c oxidase subunit IV